ncbi:MAG: MFS transporter [Chloroflexi bacterium]|nr:MFS transporter [Chloroflexota bacterium]
MAFLGTFAYDCSVTLPMLARYALGGGPQDFGALNVAMGIGSVVGGVLLATRVTPSVPLVIGSASVYAFAVNGSIALLGVLIACGYLAFTHGRMPGSARRRPGQPCGGAR